MRIAISLAAVVLCAATASAQEGGNQIYNRESGNQGYGARAPGSAPPLAGDLLLYDPKELVPAPYVEAYVLLNLKPDAFVAVFAAAQEAPAAVESNRKVDRQIAEFTAAIQPLGVRPEHLFVDFISQNPVYDYAVAGRTAREGQTGFQTKKTVAVRYTDRALFERLVAAAAQAGIYDLVKVDYLVADMGAARARLFEEATRVVARKTASYGRLLGVSLRAKAVSEERYAAYSPGELYRTYTAFEAGEASVSGPSARVVEKRKTSTSYYNPLTGANFDAVVDPAGVEPVVQCTLFLKVRCEAGAP